MDNIQANMQSTMTSAQFSASKSFSESSFSAMRQSSVSQQAHAAFTNQIPSNFSKLSLDSPNFMNEPSLFKNSFASRAIEDNNPQFENNFYSNKPLNAYNNGGNNFPNFSMSHTQGAQFSNTRVTQTVRNKVIRKRKITTMINGKVEEIEEEYDEVESEPTTEQFVMNNASKFENMDLNIGGNFFNNRKTNGPIILASKENEDMIRNKTKAIEGPTKTSKIKSIFNIGKKKKPVMKNVGNTERIIEELLTTEEKYVKDLQTIVEHFMPELERTDAPAELRGSNRHNLFGNVEIICMFHDVQFITDLHECEKSPDEIANCFLKHRKEFYLYRQFNRNQPHSEIYLGKYESFFNKKAAELSNHGLRNYMILPTQRLCRYILLMEQLDKECKKHNLKIKEVEEVLEMLKAENRLGNDLMALDAIKNNHIDLKDQGELIYRDKFTIQKGKDPAYTGMVFLFEKVILFTSIKLENNTDILYYEDFIYLTDVGLTECSNDSKKFKVWFHKHTLKPYTLRTSDKENKKKWVSEIRKQLENELKRSKNEQAAKRTLINLKNIEQEKQNINIIP